MIRTSLVVAALLGWSSIAAAQSDAEPPAPAEAAPVEAPPAEPPPAATATMLPPVPQPAVEAEAKKKITVLFAPLRLIIPLVEFTAEYRVADKLGVSITLGAGKRTIESGGSEATGTELEGGAQVRYYLIGDFEHGMQAGVEALEEYVKFDEPLPAGVIAVAAGGFTVGGFLGYKIATNVGFTFEAQLGARYVVIEPAAQGASGASFEFTEKWLPLLHLNVGWSF